MKDKWMNINYENDELKPYEEPKQDFSDNHRIETIVRDTTHTREQILDSLTSRKYDDIMAFYLLLAMRTNENDTNVELQPNTTTANNNNSTTTTTTTTTKNSSDTSNQLASKIVSASIQPSTSNDKENLPSIDKQHRPITAAITSTINDHTLINGTTTTTNGVNNPLLTSSSIDTSTANNGQHLLLKTSASGGPSVPSNSSTNRTNNTEKLRSQTVRLPATGVRRRETLDPVPGGMSMRKVDNNNSEKPKTPTGDTYVLYIYI